MQYEPLTPDQAARQTIYVGGFPKRHTEKIATGLEELEPNQLEIIRKMSPRILAGQTMILQGGYGSGKTHIACQFAYTWNQRRYSTERGKAIYFTLTDLLGEQKAWYANHEGDEPMGKAKAAGLLVVDEVTIAHQTKHDQALIRELIDKRYRDKKATIMITNLTEEGLLEAIDCPTFDRCLDGGVGILELEGGSKRGGAA